uniref:Uncharacterized protein n=1 Tax=Anopheles dirus TaxID=7168 RepID=A0A182NWL3_9DIPT
MEPLGPSGESSNIAGAFLPSELHSSSWFGVIGNSSSSFKDT